MKDAEGREVEGEREDNEGEFEGNRKGEATQEEILREDREEGREAILWEIERRMMEEGES